MFWRRNIGSCHGACHLAPFQYPGVSVRIPFSALRSIGRRPARIGLIGLVPTTLQYAMSTQSRAKTVVYKRAEVIGVTAPADALSLLLQRGLAACAKAEQRHFSVGSEQHTRILNTPRKHLAMAAGVLIEFVPGELPMTVKLREGAEEYELTQVARPSAQEEFLRSQLFFGVLGDHVAIAQSPSLKAGHLEEYLTWFLAGQTKVLESSAKVILHDQIHLPEGVTEKKLAGVRSVRLTTSATAAGLVANGDELAPSLAPSRGSSTATLLRRLVSSMLPPDISEALTGLAAEEGLAVEDLEVSFEVRRSGRIDKESRSLIDELAEVTRNSDDIDFSFEVPGVGTITRRQLQLRKPISIKHTNGAAHFDELVPKLYEWLAGLIADGEIAAPRM
jgi:hypothetical protein